jgi:hypothetical protein
MKFNIHIKMRSIINLTLILALILVASANRLRTAQALEKTNYALVNKSSGQVIKFNAKLQKLLWSPLDTAQPNYWTFERTAKGNYIIRSTSLTTQAMTVNLISMADNAFLWTNDYWGGANQRWYMDMITDSEFMLRAEHSGKCMTQNGDVVQLPCNQNDNRQRFTLKIQPALNFPVDTNVAIVNKATGQCARFNAINTAVHQQYCDDAQPNFWVIKRGNDANTFQIQATVNQQVFDILGINQADGAILINWNSWNGPNQKWYIEQVDATYYQLRATHSSKCLSAQGTGYDQRPCNKLDNNQLFNFKPQPPSPILPNTDYMIVNDGNGLCVRFQGNVTKVAHVPCNQTYNEFFWNFTKNADNTYYMMTKASNQVITVKDISQANGYVIWNNVIWGGENQKWFVEYINNAQFILRAKHSLKCMSSTPSNSDALQYPCNNADPKQIYTLRTRAPPSQQVSGVLINAMTGLPLPSDVIGSATITFTNNATGEVIPGTINPDGTYGGNLPNGTYTATVTAAGYITSTSQIIVNNTGVSGNIILSPVVQGYRIVLRWNAVPKDLDLYCQNTRTNAVVFYNSKVAGPVNLDVDKTTGNGPETITINSTATDIFKIVVRNYSKELPLSSSAAKVDIYSGDRLAGTFDVPTSGTGTSWDVANINSATAQIETLNRLY